VDERLLEESLFTGIGHHVGDNKELVIDAEYVEETTQ